MEHSRNTSLRDMLDMVARMLKKYQTERGAKQSFKYEVGFLLHFLQILINHLGHSLLQKALLAPWPSTKASSVKILLQFPLMHKRTILVKKINSLKVKKKVSLQKYSF